MSNASLKEQLQAFAPKLADKTPKPPQAKARPHAKPQAKPSAQPKPKPKWLDYVQYGVELLKAYFPACFKSMNDVKPLKKGIKLDLVKKLSTLEGVVTEDKACMVKSLSYYVNTLSYHKSVREGVMRIDLDGQPADPVTAEEATYSLEKWKAKVDAKRQNVSPRNEEEA